MASPARAAPDDPPDWAGSVRAPPTGSPPAANDNAAAFAALQSSAWTQRPGGAFRPDYIAEFAYDLVGQKLTEMRGAWTPIQGLYGRWTYGADGEVLTKRDGVTTITYKYDALNRRTYKTFKVALSPFDVAYGYDLAGRPLSALFYQVTGSPGVAWSYDAAGRRISEATNGLTLAFGYDSDSNPATLT